jgi:Tetratricopeptide repeat
MACMDAVKVATLGVHFHFSSRLTNCHTPKLEKDCCVLQTGADNCRSCLSCPSRSRDSATKACRACGHSTFGHEFGFVQADLAQHEAELARKEAALGPDHREVADCLSNIAIIHNQAGDAAAAQPLYERALKIFEKCEGPDSQEVAHTLTDLAVRFGAFYGLISFNSSNMSRLCSNLMCTS